MKILWQCISWLKISYKSFKIWFSSVLFEKWGGDSFLEQNRTLEYLRHSIQWDRLILRQTDNSWPSYSQDLNPPDHFLKEYLKTEFVETIHRQKRTSSEEKSDGFHKKWLTELWTILMFELLLCCYIAASVHGANIVLITEKV